ncbi:MAG: Kdo hydroxylase family protein [Chlamydiales bacterium]
MAKKIIVEGGDGFNYCGELEAGNILFFPSIPFSFPQEEIDFLLKQKQGGSAARKNIAYKPQIDRITNHDASDPIAARRLKEILKNYSQRVTEYLSGLLFPYAKDWRHDFASFRPFQEKGRKLRLRARNDLLHVDAFPTRPLHGSRIFRFFTNINPVEERHWVTSDGFEELAKSYASTVVIPPSTGYGLINRLQRKMKLLASSVGLKIPLRSPYDSFMLNMHNFLKENGEFQRQCRKDHWKFPPGSCWAVFTDQVSHAALAGQYALEQTFIVPQKALLFPERSPASVLERMSGRNLIDHQFLTGQFP